MQGFEMSEEDAQRLAKIDNELLQYQRQSELAMIMEPELLYKLCTPLWHVIR